LRRVLLVLILFFSFLCLSISSYSEEGAVEMKKVVMIIAENNFRDEELLHTKEVLEQRGHEVKTASTSLATAKGTLGAQAKPDMLLKDINAGDFDAIVFVGGGGSNQYWNDKVAHKLAKDALGSGKIVAAICIAPVTLANAGILSGRKATVWSSEADKLKAAGANFTGSAVERDGKVITASGPTAARAFGEEIAKALK